MDKDRLKGFLFAGGIITLLIFITVGLILFSSEKKKVDKHNDDIDKGRLRPGEPEPTPQQKKENQKDSCQNLSMGTSNFVRKFSIQRFPRTEGIMSDLPAPSTITGGKSSASILGITPKYGVPYGCVRKEGETECMENTFFFDMNLDNDNRFIAPTSFRNASFAKSSYKDYHFRENDEGFVNGMTGDEASAACFLDEGCGSFVAPACEFGFKYFTAQNLNEFLKERESIKNSSEQWIEPSQFWDAENENFTSAACVRVLDDAATKAKDAAEIENDKPSAFSIQSMMNMLDFSQMRSLNFDNRKAKSMYTPFREAYFWPKGKKVENLDASKLGAKGKKQSNVDKQYSFELADDAKNMPIDGYVMQYWTGDAGSQYSGLDAGVAYPTPCDAVNKLMGEDLLTTCRTALNDDAWVPMKCNMRSSFFRAARAGVDLPKGVSS
jgi:hypothetical protein